MVVFTLALTGLSLASALAKRESDRARRERELAARKAAVERDTADELERRREVDWREGNPRAQELWAAAWDISNGFEAASAAMQDYVAYRDARLKPG